MTAAQWRERQELEWGGPDAVADVKELHTTLSALRPRALRRQRVPWLTKSCHICANQGLYEPCTCTQARCGQAHSQGARCVRSACRACIEGSFGDARACERDGGAVCPPCLGVCNCSKHLGQEAPCANLPFVCVCT